MSGAIYARARSPLWAIGLVAIAGSAGFAIAQGQGIGLLLGLLVVLLFGLPLVAGRPEWVLAVVLAASVVAVGPFADGTGDGYFRLSSIRLPLLLVASAAVLLVGRDSPLPRRAVLLYSGLLLFLAVGLPLSPDPPGGAEYLLKLCVPLAVAGAIASLGLRGARFAEMLGLGVLGATLLVDYAMLAVGAGYYLPGGTDELRFGGLTGSGPSTGFVLSLLGVFSLVLWLSNNRLLPLSLWIASFPLLLATLTRSAIAAWLLGSLMALLIAKRLKLTAVFAVVATAVVLGNATLANRSIPGQEGGWNAVIASIQERGVSGISTTGRANLWDEMILRFKEHPLAGDGLGAAQYYSKRITDGEVEQAHSEYLTLLVGGGLIALSLWMMTWIVLARTVWRGGERLAVSAVIAYALLAAVDSPVENYAQGGAMVGIVLGWALARNEPEVTARK